MKFNSIKQQFFATKNNLIIHNRYVLYILLIVSLANLYYLAISQDYISVYIFLIIGFLTTFFSKNMIIILFFALIFTNILKAGYDESQEGLSNKNDEYEQPDDDEIEGEQTEDENDEDSPETNKKSSTKKEYSSATNKKSQVDSISDKKSKKNSKENLVGSEINVDNINTIDVINKIKKLVEVLKS